MRIGLKIISILTILFFSVTQVFAQIPADQRDALQAMTAYGSAQITITQKFVETLRNEDTEALISAIENNDASGLDSSLESFKRRKAGVNTEIQSILSNLPIAPDLTVLGSGFSDSDENEEFQALFDLENGFFPKFITELEIMSGAIEQMFVDTIDGDYSNFNALARLENQSTINLLRAENTQMRGSRTVIERTNPNYSLMGIFLEQNLFMIEELKMFDRSIDEDLTLKDRKHSLNVMKKKLAKMSNNQAKGEKDLRKTLIRYKNAKKKSRGADKETMTLLIELYENFTPAFANEDLIVDAMKQSLALYSSEKTYSEIEGDIAIIDRTIEKLALRRLEIAQERQALAAKF